MIGKSITSKQHMYIFNYAHSCIIEYGFFSCSHTKTCYEVKMCPKLHELGNGHSVNAHE